MNYKAIILKKEGSISTIIMNRPEVLNALNHTMWMEMEDALRDLYEDDNTRVVILTGAGRAFTTGADFRYRDVRDGKFADLKAEAEDQPVLKSGIQRGKFLTGLLPLLIQRLDKPTIAMVNGPAIGAGADLALACDMQIMSNQAWFQWAYILRGMVPMDGACWFLPRLIGTNRAMELLLTGDRVSAEEALNMGLVNKVVSQEKLEEVTMDLATKIANGPRSAIQLTIYTIYAGQTQSLRDNLDLSMALNGVTKETTAKGTMSMGLQKETAQYEGE